MKVTQAPYSTTLLSSIKGAYEHYYNKELDPVLLFGLTGHAFVTAISRTIGPCAPYTWNMTRFKDLVEKGLGLSIMDREYPVDKTTTEEDKQKLSNTLKDILDRGNLVFVNSYEFQLITGYNETHFITTKPWESPSVTGDIEINTFNGIKDFVLFSEITQAHKLPLKKAISLSIEMAIEQYTEIETLGFITQGIKAYDYMLEELNEKSAADHGIWWVSTVWAENRSYASKYMQFLKTYYDNEILDNLSKIYDYSNELFVKLSDKSVKQEDKRVLIESLKANELKAMIQLERLITSE